MAYVVGIVTVQLVLQFTLGILIMQHGWGLTVANWGWLIWGTIASGILGFLSGAAIKTFLD